MLYIPKLFSYFLIFSMFFSCKIEKKEKYINQNYYEYIIKDKDFRDRTKDSLKGNYIELNSGHTYYEMSNNEYHGSALILVHGFSVPSYIWDPTYESAKKRGIKVVRFDLYGRGFSENLNLPYSDSLFASQAWQLLDSLSINKIFLVGLSNGGRVISKMAQINPNRIDKLIYVSSNSFLDVNETIDKSVSKKEVKDYIAKYELLSKLQLNDFKYPEKYIGWEKKYSELFKYKGFARALISTRKNHISLDLIHKEISKKKIPIYMIWGKHDSVVKYDSFESKLDALFPNRKEFFFEEAGHLPQIEVPAEFEKVLFDQIINFRNKKT